jgi:hypothetical protein
MKNLKTIKQFKEKSDIEFLNESQKEDLMKYLNNNFQKLTKEIKKIQDELVTMKEDIKQNKDDIFNLTKLVKTIIIKNKLEV